MKCYSKDCTNKVTVCYMLSGKPSRFVCDDHQFGFLQPGYTYYSDKYRGLPVTIEAISISSEDDLICLEVLKS